MSEQTLQEAMRLIVADCDSDAAGLEGRPFTGRAVGESLGTMLAMIQAVAKAVDLLTTEVEELHLALGVSHTRTDRLA